MPTCEPQGSCPLNSGPRGHVSVASGGSGWNLVMLSAGSCWPSSALRGLAPVVEGGFFRKNVLPLGLLGSLGLVPQLPEIGVLGGQNSVLCPPRPTGKHGPGIHHLPAWHNRPTLTHTRVCTCVLLEARRRRPLRPGVFGCLSKAGSLRT